MAQLVIAAAGAAIGGAIPGFGIAALGISGSGLGWAIGSVVGSLFAPTQKGEGPRLSDLTVSSSAYGTPIPYVLGEPRLAGQIVWASNKREIATTTEQGKGGGGSEYTTYTYECDLLYLLTDNVVPGLARTWQNGELVWNKSASADAATIAASDAAPQWRRITFYDGNASQLPDPTYEAAVGTANALAYRGRGTVFIEGLQLGSSGQIPNQTFEISAVIPSIETSAEVSIGPNTSPQVVVLSDQYALCVYANGASGARASLIDISGADPVVVSSNSITGATTSIGNLERISDTQALWISKEAADLRPRARIVGHIGTSVVAGASTLFPSGTSPGVSGDSSAGTSMSALDANRFLTTYLYDTYRFGAFVITVSGWTAPVIGALNISSSYADPMLYSLGVALGGSSGVMVTETGSGTDDLRVASLTVTGDTVAFGALSDIIDTDATPSAITRVDGTSALVAYSKFTGVPGVSNSRSVLVSAAGGGASVQSAGDGYLVLSHRTCDTGAAFAGVVEGAASKMHARRLSSSGAPVTDLVEISDATTSQVDLSPLRTGTGAVVVYSRSSWVYGRILRGN